MKMEKLVDEKLLCRVDEWIAAHKDALLADIVRMVNIKSVSEKNAEVKPFGAGCRAALAEMLKIGEEHGFHTHNFENYCGALWLEEKEETIGFWGHLDVVPEGDNWDFEPYHAIIKDGFLIGRGAQDNKGPTLANLYLMQCLKELNVPMKHGLKLFVGCDEEHGMKDVEYYTAHYPTPNISVIADSGFPVCYGEKGIIETNLVSNHPLSADILAFHGGMASNIVPDYAEIRLKNCPDTKAKLQNLPEKAELEDCGDTLLLKVTGVSKHTAFPEGGVNAIALLSRIVTEAEILSKEDEAAFAFLNKALQDFNGTGLQIVCSDEESGALTCVGSMIHLDDGKIVQHFNIRYPITADSDALLAAIDKTAADNGFAQQLQRLSKPNHFPKEHPAVSILTETYNQMTGSNAVPTVMGGGTYARKLPNAFAFGMGLPGGTHPSFFRPGHGDCHSPDEGLDIENLIRAMRIMAMSIVNLAQADF